MKKTLIWCLSCAVATGFVFIASAGKTHVNGYVRKDGTYVNGYDRNSSGTGSSSGGYGPTYNYYPAPSTTYPTYPKTTYPTAKTTYKIRVYSSASSSSAGHYTSSGHVGARDSRGRIVRSASAKHKFMQMTGYPHGRPGYVVDHIIALKHGGADDPSNMQWQTIAEGKAKDKWE